MGESRIVRNKKGKQVKTAYECFNTVDGQLINSGISEYSSLKEAAERIGKRLRINVSPNEVKLNKVFSNKFRSVTIKEIVTDIS